ncbi:MAG TPA: NADPH-dependent 7-cyano-7-deazaguanine reductase QueF [Bacillota bacterium]|nr:NADPH-dependent 7-cyano-7-deazaguanine reductase QueF [Bacillota bacterium]
MKEERVTLEQFAEPAASITAEGLKKMTYQYASQPAEVEYWTDEFICGYPGQDLPARGSLYVRYVPSAYLLELDSLRLYLLQYSNVTMLHEHIVTRVLGDLVKICRPVSMTVEGEFVPRDGLGIRAKAHYLQPRR